MLRSILKTDLMGNKLLIQFLHEDLEALLLLVTTFYCRLFQKHVDRDKEFR